jgi:YidC/Oxa1 family membrane protein insertase
MSVLFGVPVDAAYHLVYDLTSVLTPLFGGAAAVAAIIGCTLAVRILVAPLTFRALRAQAAAARLAPEIQRLRGRYGRQPDRFQRELTLLYQREGTSRFAGFGPLLAQWPVFSVLYLLFRSPSVAGGPNLLLSRDLLGVPLGSHWLSGAALLSPHGAVFAGVLAVLALACWLLARGVKRTAAPGPQPGVGVRPGLAGNAAGPAGSPAAVARPGLTGNDADPAGSSAAVAVLARVLPYVTVLIAAFAPLAAVVYLITATAGNAGERLVFARLDAVAKRPLELART